MKIWRHLVIFYIGGMLYTGVELLWRGWSHSSMFLLGGFCFWMIGQLNARFPHLSVLGQMVLATALVVGAELVSGVILNRWLGLAIWDYSAVPFQFIGQICLPYALLWFPLTGVALFAEDELRKQLFAQPKPQYRWV